MKATLSEEQRQAVGESGDRPLEIVDDATHRVFYLISAEQYEKARRILEGIEDIDPSFYEVEDVQLSEPPQEVTSSKARVPSLLYSSRSA
jgi:hypothetical protein